MKTGQYRPKSIGMAMFFVTGFVCALLLIFLTGSELIQDSPGPYQVSVSSADGSVFVLDTRNGFLWQRTEGAWRALGTPQEPMYESEMFSR